jgi:hypothetical protein
LLICRYASINRSLKAREIVLVVIVRDSWKSENNTSMHWCLCFSPGIRGFLNQCFKYRFKDDEIVRCGQEQHALLDFHGASHLKQQSKARTCCSTQTHHPDSWVTECAPW